MNLTKILFIPVLLFFIILSCSREKTNNTDKANIKESVTESPVSIPAHMDAALNGNSDKVKEFIAGGLVVDTTDENGSTAMMLAAYNNHTEIVKYLLGKGADINHRDINNRTALMYASSGPANETVKLLLEAGAEVNVTDNIEGFTAIMFAAAEGQTEVFKTLMDAGADINIKDKDGETALDFASNNCHSAIVRLIDNR